MPRNVAARLMRLEIAAEARHQRMLEEVALDMGVSVEVIEAAIADGQRNAARLGLTPQEYILRSFASLCDQTATVADLDPAMLERMVAVWPNFIAEIEEVIADGTRRL